VQAEGARAAQREPNRYFDPHLRCDSVKLLPGEYYVTNREIALVTVLGSCVAACIRDRKEGIGGMNHFMLPRGCVGAGAFRRACDGAAHQPAPAHGCAPRQPGGQGLRGG
jgi:hypothetical protein